MVVQANWNSSIVLFNSPYDLASAVAPPPDAPALAFDLASAAAFWEKKRK